MSVRPRDIVYIEKLHIVRKAQISFISRSSTLFELPVDQNEGNVYMLETRQRLKKKTQKKTNKLGC